MKKFLLFMLVCAFASTYSDAAPNSSPRPRHKMSRSFNAGKTKTKKVRVRGYDRARGVKRIRTMRGVDYYSYANRPSYLRMMGRAINSAKYLR